MIPDNPLKPFESYRGGYFEFEDVPGLVHFAILDLLFSVIKRMDVFATCNSTGSSFYVGLLVLFSIPRVMNPVYRGRECLKYNTLWQLCT